MKSKKTTISDLDQDKPGLDEATVQRRKALKALKEISLVDFIMLLCDSGSHCADGSVDPLFEESGKLQPKIVTREQVEAALKAGQADMTRIRLRQRKPRGRW